MKEIFTENEPKEYFAFQYSASMWRWSGTICVCCRESSPDYVYGKHHLDKGRVVKIIVKGWEK